MKDSQYGNAFRTGDTDDRINDHVRFQDEHSIARPQVWPFDTELRIVCKCLNLSENSFNDALGRSYARLIGQIVFDVYKIGSRAPR